jgi:ABC-2 type transport system permease protein
MTAGNAAFQLVEEHGWRMGLRTLLRGEFSSWFKSRKVWLHILIWLLGINFILFLGTFGVREAQRMSQGSRGSAPKIETVEHYAMFGGLFVAAGVIIVMQGAIAGEKRSGTAAWVLSKPVSRIAFVVSKLVSNTLGLLITAVLVPGVVAYLIIGGLTPLDYPAPADFIAGLALLSINMFFWLTLTLMAGAFSESLGMVIAIPMAVLFGQLALGMVAPALLKVFPLALSMGADKYEALIESVIMGATPFSWAPVVVTVLLSIVFIVVAMWRFDRQEF